MKVSWNWINDYLTCESLSIEEAASLLTSIGLEVESIEKFESIKGGLENFFIGEVVECEKHPNADKLKLTKVDMGDAIGIRKIVCGAPNVQKGQKVAVALEGAMIYLPNGESFRIKNASIRGEESQGMICAEDELGIGTNHDGILVLDSEVKIGIPAASYFNIATDFIIEIGLTPNRTDAMSHRGVARDLAAVINARGGHCEFHPKGKATYNYSHLKSELSIHVNVTTNNAPKFGGLVMEDLQNESSPNWLINRLKAIGETPKNFLVDVTNYILHDLGQPLHAYDYDKLKGGRLTVEDLSTDEEFIALNGNKVKLLKGDIVIRDENRIVGLAGIMGSQSSCIDSHTNTIYLEGAVFNSSTIRKASQRIQLRTEAAIKFEKGIDPHLTEWALEKARDIISSVVENAKSGPILVTSKDDFPFWEVRLTRKKLDMYASIPIEEGKIEFILTSLGIDILKRGSESWLLSVPRFKADVQREEDIIEEILRIYGYDSLPYPKFLRSNLSFSPGISKATLEEDITNQLVGSGFQEILTNSISQSRFFPSQQPIRLLNSMTSELDCMRSSMIPGFLEVIEYNINRDQKDLSIFEIGNDYSQDGVGKYKERRRLMIACTGFYENPNWQRSKGISNDYFHLKSIVEKLFKGLKLELAFRESNNEDFQYGLQLFIGKTEIGTVGELKWNKKLFDIKQRVYLADLDLDSIFKHASERKIRYKEVSKFPVVRRDLALVLNDDICFDQVEEVAKKSVGNMLIHIQLFDIFKDKSLGEDKKSYAVRFHFNHNDKTLSDKEIDNLMNKLIESYRKQLAAEIRS